MFSKLLLLPNFYYDLNSTGNTISKFTFDVEQLSEAVTTAVTISIRAIVALHGHGNIVAGVERALGGHFAGDSFSTTVSPAEGYGERRDDWTQRVSKKHLVDAPRRPRVGMQVALQTEHGARPVTVIKVGSSVVDVDLNHPMAGMTLRFDIEVMSVRAAEAEEVAHGHAHGPGGHGH